MPGINHASAEAWDARLSIRERRAGELQRRRAVQIVDGLLFELEEVNLDGRGGIEDPLMSRRLSRVEAELGRRLPRAARLARTTAGLHSALLDWLELLLDEAVHGRAELAQFDAETWPERRSAGGAAAC